MVGIILATVMVLPVTMLLPPFFIRASSSQSSDVPYPRDNHIPTRDSRNNHPLHDARYDHKQTATQTIRTRNKKPRRHESLSDVSTDGGILLLSSSEIAPSSRTESDLPPRIFACRCYQLVKDAFVTRGYTMKQDPLDYEHAWIIWKTGTDINMESLSSWQRPNHFPGEKWMDRKGTMYQALRQYSFKYDVPLDFVPETYILYKENDKHHFLQRLDNDGGMDVPWVLKRSKASRGRGVTMLGPRSTQLYALRNELKDGRNDRMGRTIIQSYIRNEWTYQGHKCDLRVYALVASVHPLIVYYHDGIVRTAIGSHNEENFTDTRAHLTNTSQNKRNRTEWEPVKMFGELAMELRKYVEGETGANLGIDDPFSHIRDQMKRILGIVFASFQSYITLNDLQISNAFALMGTFEGSVRGNIR